MSTLLHLVFLATGLSLFTICSAAPFTFPLPNGFPDISNPSSALTAIEEQAGGSLPNGNPPATVSQDTLTSLKLVAMNELSEVAFFTELIFNITNNVTGYEITSSKKRADVLSALNAIQGQEELHYLNANEALVHFTNQSILPCQYNFPVQKLSEALLLAGTFTDLVLGALQDVSGHLGVSGDTAIIQGVTSVIGQEGEQNGMFRELLRRNPSQLPFKTICPREFAHSALIQNFIVQGSCPSSNVIELATYQPLNVRTQHIQAKPQTLEFSILGEGTSPGLFLAYINQQNTPIVENITVTGNVNGQIIFTANFPYDAATFGNGLTITAMTSTSGPFSSAADVANHTLYGPGIIEILRE